MGKRNLPTRKAAKRAHDKLGIRSLKQAASTRSCGTCSACCTLKGVSELKKRAGTPCEKLSACSKGCSIYADRPESCSSYFCVWKLGAFDGFDRPDRLGVMIDASPHLPRVYEDTPILVAYESFEGGLEAASAFLDRLAEKSVVVLVRGNRTHRMMGPSYLLARFQEEVAREELNLVDLHLLGVSEVVYDGNLHESIDRIFADAEREDFGETGDEDV